MMSNGWKLTDLQNVEKNGFKVFSCFCCGGGSTMGYKLAGFEVLGGVDIDKQMARIYKKNHKPKYFFNMGVQDFKNLPDEEIPRELFDLDILDGSPPCSSFSLAGHREKKWGVEKKFREGQAEQVLDTLFFDFIDLAKRLQPKVIVAENVKGMISGKAKGYVKEVFKEFKEAGYSVQLFLLNGATMGVPQKRERIFFIANRLDKKVNLDFNQKLITIGEATKDLIIPEDEKKLISEKMQFYWSRIKKGESFSKAHPKGHFFNQIRANDNDAVATVVSSVKPYHWAEPRYFHDKEIIRAQSFPDDYNFLDASVIYVCGMSVPPFMTKGVSSEIAKQLLSDN